MWVEGVESSSPPSCERTASNPSTSEEGLIDRVVEGWMEGSVIAVEKEVTHQVEI